MSKIDDFVDKLINKTKQKQLNWTTTSDDNEFQTSLSNYSVAIHEFRSYQQTEYSLFVYNNEGDLIEKIKEADISDESLISLAELHKLARRYTMNFDKALDDMMGELD